MSGALYVLAFPNLICRILNEGLSEYSPCASYHHKESRGSIRLLRIKEYPSLVICSLQELDVLSDVCPYNLVGCYTQV